MAGKVVVFFTTLAAVSAAVLNANLRNVKMPEQCQDKTYCFEKSHSYPTQLIENMIQEKLPKIIEVGDRMEHRQSSEKPEDDCKRVTKFEPIYEIMDKDGNMRFVAQSNDKFLQKIRTESCVNPGRITNSRFFSTELELYNFTCVETRLEYSFVALTLDWSGLEDVEIKDGLPVCCSCKLYELDY